MQNLNDSKLTNQERQQILKLAIDKEYAQEYKKYGGEFGCSHSQWIISPDELRSLNIAAQRTDCWFDFYDEPLSKIAPFASQILFEGERVEEGEWDKTYERWCPYSYQRVLVINTNAACLSITQEGIEQYAFKLKEEENKADYHEEWSATFTELGMVKQGSISGILDIPLELLNELEDKRTHSRIWSPITNYLLQEVEERKQNQLKHREKEQQRKGYGKSKLKKKSIKKLKKGFGQ